MSRLAFSDAPWQCAAVSTHPKPPAAPIKAAGNTLLRLVVAGIASGVVLVSAAETPAKNERPSPVTITRTNYHGWAGSFVLGNGNAEAIVVPAIGRVMQFRWVGTDGPFWENPALFGKAPDSTSADWGNFGGDKTWPSPQADWGKVTPRDWPPPVAFDSLPVEAETHGAAILLTSAIDPHYGIRTQRRIALAPDQPVLRIITTYEKVTGAPKRVGVWIITQLKDPQIVYAPLPKPSRFANGYARLAEGEVRDLQVSDGLVSLRRSPGNSAKIGTDGTSLIWVGADTVVRIDSPREPQAEYPDQGSSAEVYTNPDPAAYVELELLGPLRTLKVGDRLEQTNVYTLSRPKPLAAIEAEARQAPR